MKIVYGKTLSADEENVVGKIALECGIMYDTARLLFYRNIDTVEKAKSFLNPSKIHFNNEFLLDGISQAVSRIELAKQMGEKVLIFGDYDADGVCATTVLYNCLKDFGIEADKFIPERELGYGLNVDKVKELACEYGSSLLITVDCGISDYEKIAQIKEFGIDVIVTDHHEPPEILPDCIKINPKIKGQAYPFKELCGAGVAYKLGRALIGGKADSYLDYVALATVADSMDLIGENRDIVAEGLKLFNSSANRLPFVYLLENNDKQITSQTLAYSIAPKINAGGRMGDIASVLKLLTSNDPNEIFDLVVKLNEYNTTRQVECDRIFKEAKAKILNEGIDKDSIILVYDNSWKSGFLAIVAAKLVETFNKPAIVFTAQDGYLKGSARSVEGINIHSAITAAKDLLIGFGGHSQAAGLSVDFDKFESLRDRLCALIAEQSAKEIKEPVCYAEWEINSPIDFRFAKEISLLEPFGTGNKKPTFIATVKNTTASRLKKDSPHYLFHTNACDMLYFNGGQDVEYLSLPIESKVHFEINLSTFRGKESLKGFVKKIYPEYADFTSLKLHAFRNELLKLTIAESDEIEGKIVNNDKVTSLPCSDIKLNCGTGTIYVLTNPDYISMYDIPKQMPKAFKRLNFASAINCLIVSPNYIPDNYLNVVYLDKPYSLLRTKANVNMCDNLTGYKDVDNLSVDRTDFTEIFNYLCTKNKSDFVSSVDFYQKEQPSFNAYQFVFATEVFLELGFFSIDGGVLLRDNSVKNALTNSKLYSKISLIKS